MLSRFGYASLREATAILTGDEFPRSEGQAVVKQALRKPSLNEFARVYFGFGNVDFQRVRLSVLCDTWISQRRRAELTTKVRRECCAELANVTAVRFGRKL